ncbi:MAG: hypothetical protein PVF68_00365 [Acidobacteriota bacterium]|jgi:hypothetical protein
MVSRRLFLVLLGAIASGSSLSCGPDVAPGDRTLIERQRFEVQLRSWAPQPDGRIALDLDVRVTGQSTLQYLTVRVQQVDAQQRILRDDPLPLDVSGMGFDDERAITTHVPSAGDALDALAVVLENVPPVESRGDYPEFAGS